MNEFVDSESFAVVIVILIMVVFVCTYGFCWILSEALDGIDRKIKAVDEILKKNSEMVSRRVDEIETRLKMNTKSTAIDLGAEFMEEAKKAKDHISGAGLALEEALDAIQTLSAGRRVGDALDTLNASYIKAFVFDVGEIVVPASDPTRKMRIISPWRASYQPDDLTLPKRIVNHYTTKDLKTGELLKYPENHLVKPPKGEEDGEKD